MNASSISTTPFPSGSPVFAQSLARPLATLLPAAALALAAIAVNSQPGYATASDLADSWTDIEPSTSGHRDRWQDSESDSWRYRDRTVHIPELDHAYRASAARYHYAYYYIARPEYLL
jgi:hypothetical protein